MSGPTKMHRRRLACPLVIIIAIGLLVLSGIPSACHPIKLSYRYRIIDLGVLPGDNYSIAYDINNEGQVVGVSLPPGYYDPPYDDGWEHAFIWENGEMNELDQLSSDCTHSMATAINDQGQIVGYTLHPPPSPDYGWHALLGENDTITDLGGLGGVPVWSFAFDISNDGMVVGSSQTPLADHAFLWLPEPVYDLPAGMNDLGTFGGMFSCATSINNIGQVVGEAETGSGSMNIFLYNISSGEMEDLGHYPAGTMIRMFAAINDHSQVVFENSVYNDEENRWEIHVVRWDQGVVTDLGTLPGRIASWAGEINNAGQVVGWSSDGSPNLNPHAFLWENGQMINLTDSELIPPTDWVLEKAFSINEAGDIVGAGINPEGEQHGYLLKRISPDIPNQPDGPTEGEIGEEYIFSTNTTSPIEDQIRYGWDWNGDMIVDEWTDFFNSGDTVETAHVFISEGTYEIRVKANDTSGRESDWSPVHTITIALPPAAEFAIEITGGFDIHVVVSNIGDVNTTDVEWNITIDGGILINPREVSDIIGALAAGESEEISISIFGIGLGIITDVPTITVTASASHVDTTEETVTAKVFGPLVIIK